ncbi:Alpha/beta superfamily hydrolase [Candidatus Rhodobacter oscarellae]|uniref:Alpha/beta superfamily hydrolase n=1 Tax=Candidatus Rhodobacter oscarellae TaxID=1675527 RepID=A0A0J9H093_9RHOB|nr:alpha/beta fold hydrolase [Candidatus Rhodobacter lobularis]KMW59153.1 Alpha/beta superfamily hydrolase [Candidatus Rhodobacter lobularis]
MLRTISALLLTATPLVAGESVVTLSSQGQDMIGTLNLPAGGPAPVVLLLHGFTGTRNELATDHVPGGVFAYTAGRLAEAGYASLRIDFRGSGESLADMTFAQTTFESQIADAQAALAYLQGSDRVAGEDVYVIGWSQGGLVAASLAGRSGAPDGVALWNAVGDPMETYAFLGAETLAAGMAAAPDEVVQIKLPWAEFPLNGAFFDGVETHDPVAEIKAYDGPLFVASGAQDTTVLPKNGAAYIAAHEGPEALWLAEMDHVFNVFAEGETLTQMVSETIGFFEAHQD